MKTVGLFLVGFLGSLIAVFVIGITLQAVGLDWLSGFVAKASLLVAIGGGIAVSQPAWKGGRGMPSKYEQDELAAFHQAEAWRNKKSED